MEDQGFDGTFSVVLAETFARAESEGKEIISQLSMMAINNLVPISKILRMSARLHTSDGLMFSKRSGRKVALSLPQNGFRMLMAKASTVTSV